MQNYEKSGYLHDDLRFFYISEHTNEEFSFHYHDFHKVFFFLHGDVSYCVEGRTYKLSPGDIVLIGAGEIHKPILHSDNLYERIIVYLSPEYLSSLTDGSDDLGLCFLRAHEDSHSLLRPDMQNSHMQSQMEAFRNSFSDTGYGHELKQKLIFLDLLIEINRIMAQPGYDEILPEVSQNPKMMQIVHYIHEHITEDMTIDTLANEFFINRYHLMHLFKREIGESIGNYITIRRLSLARELIASGMPVTSACYECGYKNYSTFSRAYRKYFHHMPKDTKRKI